MLVVKNPIPRMALFTPNPSNHTRSYEDQTTTAEDAAWSIYLVYARTRDLIDISSEQLAGGSSRTSDGSAGRYAARDDPS